MTPDLFLKKSQNMEHVLSEIAKKRVVVGITEQSATKHVYADGEADPPSVVEVGTAHEYGLGVPRRSFLRATWDNKGKDINKIKGNIFEQMTKNKMDVEQGFELLGVALRNFCLEAFNSGGFGQWQPLSAQTLTMNKKRVNPIILVDTTTLKSSIDYEVRELSDVS